MIIQIKIFELRGKKLVNFKKIHFFCEHLTKKMSIKILHVILQKFVQISIM